MNQKKTPFFDVVKKNRTEQFCSIRLGNRGFEELPWEEKTNAKVLLRKLRMAKFQGLVLAGEGKNPNTSKLIRLIHMRSTETQCI